MSIIDELMPEQSGSSRVRVSKSFRVMLEQDKERLSWWTLYNDGTDLLVRLELGVVDVLLQGTIPDRFTASATLYYLKTWHDVFTKNGYCPKTIKDEIEQAIKRRSGTQTNMF